ncbi:MAG: TonB-dependent receptor [Flavobacteriales bacterium]|nr:TonB-dependent receptor [Candidatus Arcticimaribacter sp.]
MNLKTNFFFALLLFAFCTNAQVELKGTVLDTLQSPLERASVVAINKFTNALDAYTMTDDLGLFSLNLKQNTKYKIQVSYFGLQTINDSLSTQTTGMRRDYTLRADIELDEVVVKIPVLIRGDTLIYDADSYKNGTERKLEDIIAKLPGVDINDTGQIEVEGKVVNKLMVNGKDFFDGDTKIATKNIPSSTVDKIQVLKNFGEVVQLKGVRNNQNNVAINIKLKKGKESFWFGNITSGGGNSPTKDRYLLQPKLFYYSPKYTINFIGDLNNIGEVALSRRDLRGFGGSFRPPSSQSGTNINLGDNSLNFLTDQSDAFNIENKLATANFSYSPNENLDLSGFLIFNSNKTTSKANSFIQYTDAVLQIPDEQIDQSTTENSYQSLVKLSASYKPNINNQIDYDIFIRTTDDFQSQKVVSSLIGNTKELNETTPYSINQNLNYYFTLDEKNIFAFEAQHLFKNEDPFYNAVLTNDPNGLDAFDNTALALGLNSSLANYNIGQNRKILSNQLDAKLDYYHIINTKSNLNLTLGTILSKQEFNSNIFQFLDSGQEFDPTPNFNQGLSINDVDYNFRDLYLGVHYRFRTGKFTFTPGFSIHAYGNKNLQNDTTVKDNFLRLLPDFETRIQIKKGETLTLNYSMQNQFTDITKLARGLVLNSYNNIQYGEPELQNALSHNISLFYSSFNLFNYTNVFARVAYSSNIDQIRNRTGFENIIRTSTFFNSNFADESLNAFGRVQRTFGKIRASLNGAFNYNKINQFIQNQKSINEGYTQTLTPGIRTNFKVAPNINLRYRYSVVENKQGSKETTFIIKAPSIEFDAYIKEKFTFVTNYSYTTQELETESQSFQNWDASLIYRKNKDAKWEFELKASNILNIDIQVRNSANNLSVLNTQTFIQPRFITFRGVYNL